MELPSIDQNICGSWTELDLNTYNKLPFYLMEAEAQNRKRYETWGKLFPKINWKPNMGDTMRTVVVEPTPVIRQTAFPELLRTVPKTDVISFMERKVDTQVRHQDFVSPNFYFLPEFQDFLKHIDNNMENINAQISVFEDEFYRTNVFAKAPYMYIAGVGIVDCPTGSMNSTFDAVGSKTAAWMQAQAVQLAGVTQGYLSFEELFKALNAAEQIIGMTPYSGSGMPGGDSSPLNQKYCLVLDGEAWNNFVSDPWLLQNRPLNMNIVTDAFRGDLWGRITCKIERYPWRWKCDVNWAPTFEAPENWEVNPDSENFGQTLPNPGYSKAENSQLALAWLIGGNSYDVINIGPPPSEFTRSLTTGEAVKLQWNGKAYLNRQFMTYCKNSDGTTFPDVNSFGRYIRAQATVACGIRATTARNVMPILYKRRIGVTTV